MRILIASDLHGSLESLTFLNAKARELSPDLLLLLGDLVYHGPRNPLPDSYNTSGVLDAIPQLLDLPCPIMAVRGNCDSEVDMELTPFSMPENAWIDADGYRIFASHGHRLPERPPLKNMPVNTIILRGHTHIPRGETIDSYHFWNPGSLSLPKGGSPRTYGLYENGTFVVKDIKGNTILTHTPGIKQN